MIRSPISRRRTWFLGAVSVGLLLAGYTFLSHRQHQVNPNDKTIPTWSQFKTGIVRMCEAHKRTGERWIVEDAKATAGRLFSGLGLGVLGAVVLGVLMGCFRSVEAFLAPPLQFLAKVPPTAALAVFFVLAGTGFRMYVAMIAFGVLPSMAQAVYLSVKDVPDELLHKSYTLGASHTEVIWNIIVRQVLPPMMDAIRLQIGPAIVYLIAAEWLVGDVGFGFRIKMQQRLTNMNVVYPYLVLLGGFGFGMDYVMRLLQRWWCPWYRKAV